MSTATAKAETKKQRVMTAYERWLLDHLAGGVFIGHVTNKRTGRRMLWAFHIDADGNGQLEHCHSHYCEGEILADGGRPV